MTTQISIKQTQIEFKNSSATSDASISLNDDSAIVMSRPVQHTNGLTSTSLTVGANASIIATSVFDTLTSGDVKLKDSSTNLITVTAPSSVTSHTLTLPSAQGAANSHLYNDGSGNLSWSIGHRLVYAIQGCLKDYSTSDSTNGDTLEISSIEGISGSSNVDIPLHEYDPYSYRGGSGNDRFIIPTNAGGWYRIQMAVWHPSDNVSGTDSQSALGQFSIGVKFTNVTGHIKGSWDKWSGSPEMGRINIVRKLDAADEFRFLYFGNSATNNDYIVHASITRLT